MMLAKTYVGSVVRLCSVISACIFLASCLDGSDSNFTADIFGISGIDSSDSEDTGNETSAAPSISSISVGQGAHGIGAEVTLTFVAEDAEADLSLKSGSSFNGQQLTDFAALAAEFGYYTAVYTVTSGDPDVAASSEASASIVLIDTDGVESAETTSVALDADTSIDANAPAIAALSVAAGTYRVGDPVPITITALDSETGLALAAGSTFNGQALSDFNDNTDGSYIATYTVVEGDPDIADGTTASTNIALVDAVNNTSAAAATLLLTDARIDANSPTISSLVIAGDNIVNSSDDPSAIPISGTTTGVEVDQELTLFVGDNFIATTAVGADSSFSTTIDLAALADGAYVVTATTADLAGNPAEFTSSLSIDTVVPSIDSFVIAEDNQVNAAEATSPVTATGVVSGVEADQQVSLYIEETMLTDPITVETATDADGNFTAEINLSTLDDDSYKVVVDVYDLAGNLDRLISDLIIDTADPQISSLVVASDNTISAAEATAVDISGTTTEVENGQSVDLSITDGTTTIDTTATISNNSFTTTLDLSTLADSAAITLTATTTDLAGNAAASVSLEGIVKDTVAPSIAITSVAGDNVIDGAEVAAVAIVGTTAGAEANQSVTIAITDGITTVETSATVTDNAFTATLDTTTLADSTTIGASATVADLAGNPASITVAGIVKDTLAPAIAITSVAGDNIVNSAEAATAAIVGSTSNVENGQTASLSITDGTTTIAARVTVTNNAFSTEINLSTLADSTAISLTADLTDAVGNPASITITDIVKDTIAPSIAITSVAGDNTINATEATAVAIVGTTAGAEDDQPVAIAITDGTTTINTTASITDNAFSTEVNLTTLADSTAISLSADLTDLAGNPASITIGDITKDTAVPSIASVVVSEDNVVNAADDLAAVAIVGVTEGAENDQPVAIAITDGTTTINTTTIITDNAFSTEINLSTLADSTSINLSADTTDLAGNPTSITISNITKDTEAPSITSVVVSEDNVVNVADDLTAVAIVGTTAGVENDQPVAIAITDGTTTINTTATITANAFSTTLDLTTLADSTAISLSADLTDLAGNPTSITISNITKDTEAPSITSVVVSEDNVVNDTDDLATVVIAGTTIGVENDQPVAIAITDGTTTINTTATITANAFSTTLDLTTLADSTAISLSADLTDLAGNPASITIGDITKDTAVPSIASVVVSEDNVVNAADDLAAVAIVGVTEGAENDQPVAIAITDGTTTINTTTIITDNTFSTEINLTTLADSTAISLTANVADTAGNPTSITIGDITKDTEAPSIASVIVSEDNVVNDTDDLATVVIAGTTIGVEAEQNVTIAIDAEAPISATAAVDASGAFATSVDLSRLSNGTYDLNASVADLAGNPADPATASFTVDIEPPTQAVIEGSIALSVDTGSSASDFITNRAQQSLSAELNASLEDGEALYGSVDSGTTWSLIYSATELDGATSFTWQTDLVEGANAIQFRVADASANSGSITEQNYTLDTEPPEQSISSIALSNDTGTSASDFLTNAASQSISASLEPGLEDGDRLFGSVDSGTSWQDISNQISETNNIAWQDAELILDTNYIVLRIADAADNNSSFDRNYTLDQSPPTIETGGNRINADEASTAILDSSASSDANGIASHSWQQVESDGSALSDTPLAIVNADTEAAEVTTPAITADDGNLLNYYFTVTVTDKADNEATSLPLTLTVDNSYLTPEITATTPFLDIETGGASYFDNVGVAWAADSSLTYYLYRSTESGCSIGNYNSCADPALYTSSVDFTISDANATVSDIGRQPSTTYYYWLEAQVEGVDDPVFSSPTSVSATTSIGPTLNDTGVVRGADYPDGFDALGGGITCNGAVDESLASIDDEGTITSDDLNLDGDTEDLIFLEGEDCEHGRDVTANDPSDGHAGFSYTRLNSDGSEYSGSGDYATEPWACVLDNVTGVIWEVKTTDGGTHDTNIEYTWYNADGVDIDGTIFRGSDNGIDPTTQELVDATNAEQLCGLSNWRLPTSSELVSIRNNTIVIDGDNFSVDSDYFPNLKSVSLWSSSVNYYANADGDGNPDTYQVWNHGPEDSVSWPSNGATDEPNHAILVSSSPAIADGYFNDWSDDRYEIHNDGTVTDKITGLMWMRCGYDDFFDFYDSVNDTCVAENPGRYGAGPHHYALAREVRLANKEITNGFDDGNNHNIGGYTDWRLPSLTEIFSLRDHTAGSIGIEFITQEIVDASNGVYSDEDIGELYGDDDTALMNPAAFPNAEPLGYWTSTPRAIGGEAYFVGFTPTGIFSIGVSDMRTGYRTRLVRDAD